MTLLTPVALLGLLLLPALVALHLRRQHARSVETPSLLLWEGLVSEPAQGGKRWQLEHLLLLLLQLIAVSALVFSLARPAGTSSAGGTRVYVIDDGMLMAAPDPEPSRLAAAQAIVARDMQHAPSGTTFTIVAAGAQAHVLVSTTDRATALGRLQGLTPLAAAPELGQAVNVAAGLLPASDAHLLVLYAHGETLPAISAPHGMVSTVSIGHNTDDQSISSLSTRCKVAAATCDAFARVRNSANTAIQDSLVIEADGAVLGQKSLRLPAQSDTDLSFAVPATRHILQLYLTRRDLVGSDNLAWSLIPNQNPETVTVVGDAGHTAPVTKALAALPNIRVARRTPAQFAAGSTGAAGPLILAGWMPTGSLPPTPSLVLINPPRYPGAPAPSALPDTTVSGADTASPLLDGVDLTSLDVPPGGARQLSLPPGLQPVVSTTGGPLIAAGTVEGQRVAVFTFDPSVSNLSQLNAFPLLMSNMLQWSAAWLPAATVPGDRLTIDVPPSTSSIEVSHKATLDSSPVSERVEPKGMHAYVDAVTTGIYSVTERGSWGTRSADFAVNPGTDGPTVSAAPITVPSPFVTGNVTGNAARNTVWWPWLGLLAVVVIAAEWLVAMSRLER
jgi:Ca-activated chloride channel family protein